MSNYLPPVSYTPSPENIRGDEFEVTPATWEEFLEASRDILIRIDREGLFPRTADETRNAKEVVMPTRLFRNSSFEKLYLEPGETVTKGLVLSLPKLTDYLGLSQGGSCRLLADPSLESILNMQLMEEYLDSNVERYKKVLLESGEQRVLAYDNSYTGELRFLTNHTHGDEDYRKRLDTAEAIPSLEFDDIMTGEGAWRSLREDLDDAGIISLREVVCIPLSRQPAETGLAWSRFETNSGDDTDRARIASWHHLS